MGQLFSLDGKVAVFIGKMADLVVLNLLWLMCCLPIVTIGAATTALYSVTIKIVKDEESYIVRNFMRAFRDNFRQATIIWIGALICGNILYFNFYYSSHAESAVAKWMFVPIAFAAVLLVMTMGYIFPILSFFENSLKKTIKNALMMSVAHLPQTILILICAFLPLLIVLILKDRLFLALFMDCVIGVALTAWINSLIFVRIFERYTPRNVKVVTEYENETIKAGI